MKRKAKSSMAQWRQGLQIASIAMAGLSLSACGGGGGGGGSDGDGSPALDSGNKATACLNADLYEIGSHVDQLTLSPTAAIHADSTVTQKTSFNNFSNLTETEALEETGVPQALLVDPQRISPQFIYDTQTRQRYTRLDGTTLLRFGDIATPALTPLDPVLASLQNPLIEQIRALLGPIPLELVNVVTTVTNNPAIEKRFDLSPGQSYTQSYTSATNTNVTLIASLTTIPLIVAETPTSLKTTYVGRERISVQAGSFDACKFIDEMTTPGGTAITATWLAVGSGQFLKSEIINSGQVTELVNASINGVPLQ